MGARPIALMNVLRFGEENNFLTKHLLNGVVKGIGGYEIVLEYLRLEVKLIFTSLTIKIF